MAYTFDYLLNSDNRYFDIHIFRQTRHFHRLTSGRIGCKKATVYLVDGPEVVEVLDKNGGLHDVLEREFGYLQNGADVFHHLAGFGLNITGRSDIEGNLAGNIERSVHHNRLVVRPNWRGGIGGEYDFFR